MHFFPQLFTPGKIGSLLIKNRVVMPSMFTNLASIDGTVTERMLQYYSARARGGVGLIIVEVANIDFPSGKQGFNELRIDEPRFLAGLNELVEGIHAYQTKAFIQLFHAGRQTTPLITQGHQPVAPSPIACRVIGFTPRELTQEEIQQLEDKFVTGAINAKLAGFDGIELHAAHGYLLSSFLSPFSNKRRDAYGGSLENRMRFLLKIIDRIRETVGEMPISVRFNASDFLSGGIELEEGVEIAQRLEEAGIDALNVSSGMYESGLTSIESVSYEEGWRVYLAEAVKKAVSIPVIAGGVIRTPQTAETVLEEGKADFIFIGRGLLADAEWANKARAGKIEEIRPCVSCNTCINRDFLGLQIRCAVNPYTGREARFRMTKTTNPKRIWIIGAGPAGLQAAIALSNKGHRVELIEKGDQLGGLVNLAQLPLYKCRLGQFKEYLIREVNKRPIKVKLNTTFDQNYVQDNPPDMIVLATGSIPIIPDIRGLDQIEVYAIEDILMYSSSIRNKKFIVIGGGRNGCEVAEVLATKGNEVTIIEMKETLAEDMEKKNRRDLLNRLKAHQIYWLVNHQVVGVENGKVIALDLKSQVEVTLEADGVVPAAGYTPENTLYETITEWGPEVRIIGDALRVRGIEAAIFEGEMLAYSID